MIGEYLPIIIMVSSIWLGIFIAFKRLTRRKKTKKHHDDNFTNDGIRSYE